MCAAPTKTSKSRLYLSDIAPAEGRKAVSETESDEIHRSTAALSRQA